MNKHPDDGKFVVTQDGQRVSGKLHDSQQEAENEAKEKRSLAEGQGKQAKESAKEITVKRNLLG